MNIALCFYPLMDMGGLTNNNNNLCAGLQELGHRTTSLVFLPREDIPRNGIAGGRGTIDPHSGLEHDQMRGYTWPRSACVPYRGRALKSAIETLNSYDLVIWQIPVPTKKKENQGNSDWVQLYAQCKVPQVAYVHDGNFLDGYPWLSAVAPYLRGIGAVNHAALNSLADLDCKFSLTPSPQKIRYPDLSEEAFNRRVAGFLSLQTFKAWKHVPELIAAIPHTTVEASVAGRGIDYCYLTSKDKCKWPGVWDSAVDHGMKYHGVITNDERDALLDNLTCLVDPSWSKKYATIGDHYNRVVVEAIMRGAVPIVRPLGISTNMKGEGEVFTVGLNCLGIPQNCTPQEYGALLDKYCRMSYAEYRSIMDNAVGLLSMWDRKAVAQTFLDLANGKAQYYGETSTQVATATDATMKEFFCEQ